MKIAKIILAAAVAMMASACSSTLESQLMGKWTLQECDIPKLDSICQTRADNAEASTNKAIDLLHRQLDSTNVAAKKQELLEYEKRLKADLEAISPQSFKDEYNQLRKAQIGKMTIAFKENKQIQIHVSGADEQSGSWSVSVDTIHTLFDNMPAEILIVKDVTSNSLKLFSPAPDERSVNLVMKFSKN